MADKVKSLINNSVQKRSNKIKEGSIISDIIIYVIMILIGFVTLYPMYNVLIV